MIRRTTRDNPKTTIEDLATSQTGASDVAFDREAGILYWASGNTIRSLIP